MEIFKAFKPDLSVVTMVDPINGGKLLRVGNTGFQIERRTETAISRFVPPSGILHDENTKYENGILLTAALRAYQLFLKTNLKRSIFTLDDLQPVLSPFNNQHIKEFTLRLFASSQSPDILRVDRRMLREMNIEVGVLDSEKLKDLSESDPLTRRLSWAYLKARDAK